MPRTVCEISFVNGSLITMDPLAPQARGLSVVNDRIAAVGGADDLPLARRTVDLRGACVVPGFHDAHNHMAWYGLTLLELDLSAPAVGSLAGLYEAVRAQAAREPDRSAWIVGNSYDDRALGGHPHRDSLEAVAPGRKVLLRHRSGHMCTVSATVLRQLGLDEHARAYPGGTVVVDDRGRPTGMLQERAQELVQSMLYPIPVDRLVQAISRAADHYVSEGITSVVEAGIGGGWIGRSPIELATYQQAREAGRLPVRVGLMVASDALHELHVAEDDAMRFGLDLGIRTGFGDSMLSIGPMKIFVDGSLLGRTAAMSVAYADRSGERGGLLMPKEDLVRTITAAHRGGWQIAAHAIGDAAIDAVLEAYETALKRFPRTDPRHRIEHFGVTRADQVTRAAELGLVAVPQGRFITELGDGIRAALGERADMAYRMRSVLAAGMTLAASSDRPVVDGRPMAGIHDMVNRRTASGALLGADESISVAEALRAYTLGSAYAAHKEHERGALSVGRQADFVVLSEDPTRIEPSRLKDVGVVATFVGGSLVYDRTGELSELLS